MHRILEAGLAENAVTDREENRDIRKRDKFRSMLATAKRVFKGVFSVIWKFQEFLMPMASSIPFVGAGVTLLSKSIELLIETTKNYHEIFASAANLFEQVGFFSMRFDLVMEAQKAGATVHPKFVSEQRQPYPFCTSRSTQVNIWTDCVTGQIPERYPQAHCRLRRSVCQINTGRGQVERLQRDCKSNKDVL